ncbi:DUF397 domain-containing protein [Streptomyces luomodiensis]|uniref:DUF397 domain-containing protein n=1 Tax=Streptomyces luomodiensis TaxID=3026192 RepID=A0ABY9V2L4_9ACTN|nr:DUF397 domain-containing protein [Streptomyces sp. SCA4-21]WNE99043.1 DUF397 domain-containing protein [Streptomyces sp. SCA4-21]
MDRYHPAACRMTGNNCIEVAADDSGIAIRESSDPDAVVTTDRTALRAFLRGVKEGRFHLSAG